MAELARFLGIVVVICAEKHGKHHLPHVHARYGGYSAVFNIEDGSVITGNLPAK